MFDSAKHRVSAIFAIALLALTVPAFADDVTISGNVNFSSLDGSSLDHDHASNGTFTVDDGNLTVLGTINCNDSGAGNNSACAMAFAVSGNFTMAPGSALYAENRQGNGDGGNITVNAGGNVVLQAAVTLQPGAIISSEGQSGNGNGGNITLTSGGITRLEAGSSISSGTNNGNSGAISVTGAGQVEVSGIVSAGPSDANVSANQKGGNITIVSTTNSEPGVTVTGTATIVSAGENAGAGTVRIEGCGLGIRGAISSTSKQGTGNTVTLRSGTTITIDSRDLSVAGNRKARLIVGATNDDSVTHKLNVFARDAVQIYGADPAGALYTLNNVSGGDTGPISVLSLEGTVTANGRVAAANGEKAGSIGIAAASNVVLDGGHLKAAGSNSNDGKGGSINVRAHSGSLSWQNGSGDVRPVGSAVPSSRWGSITLTYCTTISTTGSSFPTNGAPVGPFPTTAQSCSPAAPSLPAGESALPDCNDPPVANNDSYTVAEGGTLNVPAPGVLVNDTDPDGDPITAVLVSGPVHASSFTLNPDGSFNYVHDGSETSTDSFTYKASDGSLQSNTATVTIHITPVNDAPFANNDTATVAEGGTINMAAPGVLANDTDPDGPTLTAVLVSGPAHASSFVLNPDGSYTYVHNGSETTSDSFTYQASDGTALSNVATVSIMITPVNDSPVAVNDNYAVSEGGTLNVAAPAVLNNDTDAENNALTAVLVSGPANASSFTLNADGSFTYVHNGSETTTDSFTYQASDGTALSNVATVTITIAPVNDAPVANPDTYSVNEGGTLNVAAPGVLGNDTDAENNALTAVLVSGPANASSFTFNADGSFAYVHNGSETATDSFTYKANDGSLDSNVTTVTITINQVNDAPTAVDDSYTVAEGGTLNVAAPGVLGNDTDPENNTLSAVLVSGPAHASSFALNADGSFTYLHNGSETTSDSFTYRANDGSLNSNVATVHIAITPVNDPPVAINDSYSVNEGDTLTVPAPGVLTNDTDAENNALTAVLVSGPAHATLFTLNSDGSFTYVHDGSETTTDSFTYRANDGTSNSNIATVTITIAPVNDAPVANNDGYSVNEGGTLTVPPPGVLGNDTDPDSPTLTAILVTGPANATSFTFNADGSFSYTHNGLTLGNDSFTYRANDGSLNSNIATVVISVIAQPPTAVDDTYTTVGNTELRVGLPPALTPHVLVSGDVLDNDTDPNTPNAALIVTAFDATSANGGSVTMDAQGRFSYLPPVGNVAADSFNYTVSDGSSSDVGTVHINFIQRVWYVNAAHVGASTGRSSQPFTTLTAAQAASFVNDYIHVAAGAYSSGIMLKDNQLLVGSGVPLIVGPFTLAPATTRPTLGDTVILANGNLVTGLNVTPASNDGISGTAINGATIREVGVTGGNDGIRLTNTTGGITLEDVTLAPGGDGLVISGGTPVAVATNLDITTSTGTALVGNAGMLTIMAGGGDSTVTATNGRAIDLSNMTLNVTLLSVSASGGSTGILVQNTTGSFTVTGSGTTAGSGGTVQNASAKGADFRSATNITLKNMNFLNNATANGAVPSCSNITAGLNNGPVNCNANLSFLAVSNVVLNNVTASGSQQIGIDGQSVNGLTLTGVTVTGNGNEIGEDGVQMANLTGTVTINGNSLFRDNAASQFEIANDSGTMTATVTSSTFSNTNFPGTCLGSPASPGNCTANSGLQMIGYGTATMNSTVTSSLFQNIYSYGVQQNFSAGAAGTVKFGQTGAGNTFTNNGLAALIGKTGTGNVNYEIRDNIATNNTAVTSTFSTTAFSVSFGGNGVRTGVIDNNSVGTNLGTATASGCFVTGCDGFQVTDSAAQGTHNLTISNNQIYHVKGAAIRVTSSGASTDTFRVKVQGNVANFPDNPSSTTSGILVQDGNATPNGAFYSCVDINSNQIQGLWAGGASHRSAIRILATRAQQFSLTNFNTATEYAPGAVTVGCTAQCTALVGADGNAADFISSQNPLTVAAQTASGGSSASQQRLAASAPWTGTTGACP